MKPSQAMRLGATLAEVQPVGERPGLYISNAGVCALGAVAIGFGASPLDEAHIELFSPEIEDTVIGQDLANWIAEAFDAGASIEECAQMLEAEGL